MNKNDKIYIAGHRGLVGSAITRRLESLGFTNLLLQTSAELDLRDQRQTAAFFAEHRPDYVFLAAAKVGGILANNNFPADFILDNLLIQNNIIENAHKQNTKRLLFLGSSCIYPKESPQPIKEEYLLTGPLEPTNRPYALAKISGIEMCWSFNRQHGTKYLAAMPTNLYGPNDNFHATNSHVIPGLIRKFHTAKSNNENSVEVWGSGRPRREFLYSDDMAEACVFLMNMDEATFEKLVAPDQCPLINVGSGTDISILELANLINETVGTKAELHMDASKPDGTMQKLMDSSRLRSFGWAPKVDLREGLKRTYEEFCKKN